MAVEEEEEQEARLSGGEAEGCSWLLIIRILSQTRFFLGVSFCFSGGDSSFVYNGSLGGVRGGGGPVEGGRNQYK